MFGGMGFKLTKSTPSARVLEPEERNSEVVSRNGGGDHKLGSKEELKNLIPNAYQQLQIIIKVGTFEIVIIFNV